MMKSQLISVLFLFDNYFYAKKYLNYLNCIKNSNDRDGLNLSLIFQMSTSTIWYMLVWSLVHKIALNY